ncbi:MAG TPA: carboxyl transferase domain-containing protein [Alphaproteobacteria bacterium]|jgi:acetyl-CoA carboxylase carboxyltransferase component|nr:carboxyl transferase domain-containing protein [Alphaproteobacteria bacterium]
MRKDVAKVQELRAANLDAARPEAVAKRRKTGHWTAREQIDAFLDAGTFAEYGALARPVRDDMAGAADGLITGIGEVEGRSCAIMAYDYTVHAGTQSLINHKKHDRIFEVAERLRLPLICWLEGGGARPHDMFAGLGLDLPTFMAFARLSGQAPLVGIVTGRCFAGNANLAGMCDVLIATPKANIGMAGPPLVEAALGKSTTAEEIGPVEVQLPNGVIDLLAEDEGEAIQLAKQYLGYFGGPGEPGEAPDGKALRDIIPENPRRAYDVRKVIAGIADVGSVLELRAKFGRAIVTALVRLEGRPLGVIANQPIHMAGAIDSPASDKAARFIQLCDAFDVPLLFLCDTPGLMVGPEIEKTALVRHSGRLLLNLASASVPFMTVILRKAYGLGGYVMGARGLDPALCLGWPTAEFGGMGLEGAVNITHRAELAAAPDEAARQAIHDRATAELKRMNTGLEVAAKFEIDDIIDPAETRHYLGQALKAMPAPPPRNGRKRVIDAW